MTPESYRTELSASSRLKLRAKRLLALGSPDERFEASVLLHEAARKELRAAQMIAPGLDQELAATRLGALVEACTLLIDARDPTGAAEWYGALVNAGDQVDPELARAMGAEVARRFAELQGEFAAAFAKAPELQAPPPWATLSQPALKRKLRAAEAMAKRFPGEFRWWVFACRAAEQLGDGPRAWEHLTRARRLEPDRDDLEAMSAYLAGHVLPREEAERHLGRVADQLAKRSAVVSVMYGLTQLSMLPQRPKAERERRLRLAISAARTGLTCEPSARELAQLRAVVLLAEAQLAGDEPSLELLYRAGLPDLAVRAAPGDDPTELLTASIRDAA